MSLVSALIEVDSRCIGRLAELERDDVRVLVTSNVRHMSRIKGLVLENWLA